MERRTVSYDDHNSHHFCHKHMVSTAHTGPGFCRVCRDIEPELDRLRAENERLRAIMDGAADETVCVLKLVDASRRLVHSLPRCTYCPQPATHAYRRGEARYCDGCAPSECPPYPRAQPLRDTIAALKELEKT
jgi:hypothetical protein